MERKISILQSNSNDLKVESENTLNLLDQLHEMNTVKMRKFMEITETTLKFKEFVQISQFQCSWKQKLLALNVELETFLIENGVSESSLSQSLLSLNQFNNFGQRYLSCDSSLRHSNEDLIKSSYSLPDANNVICEVPEEQIVTEQAESDITSPVEEQKQENNETAESEQKLEIETVPEVQIVIRQPHLNILPVEEHKEDNFTENKTITDVESTNIESPQKLEVETAKTVEPTKPLDALQILSSKTYLSQRDRYEHNLLKDSVMPDLRVKRCGDSISVNSRSSSRKVKDSSSNETETSSIKSPISLKSKSSKITADNISKSITKDCQNSIISKSIISKSSSENKNTVCNKTSVKNSIESVAKNEEILQTGPSTSKPKNKTAKKSTCKTSEEQINPPQNELVLQCSTIKVHDVCTLAHINTPSDFYIHLLNDAEQLSIVLENLESMYDRSICHYSTKAEAKKSVRKYCVGYVPGWQKWYRVEILNWEMDSDSDNVLVCTIDFGGYYIIPYFNLRSMHTQFFKFPQYAIHCKYDSLYPPSSTEDNIVEQWSEMELKYFFFGINEFLEEILRVTYVNDEDSPIGIDLILDSELNLDNTIGQRMIDNGSAVQILPNLTKYARNPMIMNQILTAQGLGGTHSNMTEAQMVEKFYSNDTNNEPKNLVEAMTAYDARDEARICPFTRPDGTCFKGRNCRLEHEQLRPDGFTTDKQFVHLNAMSELILPSKGDNIEILITCITGINEFYSQIITWDNHQHYGTTLANLHTSLNMEAAIRHYKPLPLAPTRGEIVLAKNFDSNWYRARVVSENNLYNQDAAVEVFIVDYGEQITVGLEDIRQISSDYLILPFQAVKCYLCNIQKRDDESETNIRNYMETNFLSNKYIAEVQCSTHNLFLKVYLDNVEMCRDLITAGYGDPTEDKILIKHSEQLLVD